MTRRQALTGAMALALTMLAETGDGYAMEPKIAEAEPLGQPCRARNMHNAVLVQDKGTEWFVITNTNENFHMELLFIDAATNTGEVHRAPAGSGAWALQKLPNNQLAVGTYYDGMFMIFDVPTRKWVKTIKFPGEDYIWTFAIGKDGRLYGGTYPGGKLGALDLKTDAVEDLGAPSKAHDNLYLRYTSALPDGRIFCQFGFKKAETMIFDPGTRKFTPAPSEMQDLTSGVVWNGYFLAGNRAFRSPDLTTVSPLPFPAPDAANGAWVVEQKLTSGDTLILRQGRTFWRYRKGDVALTHFQDFPVTGMGAPMVMNAKGKMYGIRGQEYFTLSPADKAVKPITIPGETAPRGTHFLRIDDRGRLWGGPTFGQTLFYLDTKTKKATNTLTVSDHGGEVYDVAVVDGITYAVAYAGGELIRFDPSEKWDQIGHKNPRTIARFGPDYIRPNAGLSVGDDGKLYSGWLAAYSVFGGLLAITDPKTGDSEKFKDPLGAFGINGLAPIGEEFVLMGTTTYGNGLGYQKDVPARLGLWEKATGKTVFVHDFPGANGVGTIVYDPASGIAAFLVDGIGLQRFDTRKREIVPSPTITINGGCLVHHGTGFLYAADDALFTLDPSSGKTALGGRAPAKIEKLAFGGPDSAAYVACGVDMYRIRI